MRILSLTQRSEAWHDHRASGIGSSDIVAIMGISTWSTARDVFEEKIGFSLKNPKSSKAIKRGVDYEDEARTKACVILGVGLQSVCVQHEEYPWFLASLDGYNEIEEILLEIKIPMPGNFEKQSLSISGVHFCQIQWQLMITGYKIGYLYIYSPETENGIIHMVMEDLSYQEILKEAANKFWKENVLKGIPPDGQPEMPEIFDTIPLEACEEYVSICNMEKQLDERKKELKGFVEQYATGSSFKCGKVIVDYCKGSTSLDKEAMMKDGIDLSKYERQGKDFYKFRISKQ